MEQFEFSTDEVRRNPSGIIVLGRCWDAEFGVGDEFTELHWKRYERGTVGCVESEIAAEVRLRVFEIH
ncbi:MAG: hypothetical protein ACRC7O_09405, partial [Fimbriiglobus sp.]